MFSQLIKTDRSKGILMSLLGVFILSPDGLIIRILGLDNATLLFYRGTFSAIAITTLLLLYYRKRFLSVLLGIGWVGILNGFMFAVTNIAFINSIQLTSVANTILILSSAPVFAAILSLIILKENQKPLTWLIIIISFIAIFIIGFGTYGSGGFLGDIIALGCAVSTGFSAVLARLKKGTDLVPSIIVGSVITALYALASAPISAIDSTQLIYLSAQCLLIIPLAYAIITIAPRFTSSAEVQLVFLLESILGPLWVWVVISETPPINTVIGGSVLLASVFWFAIASVGESGNNVDGIATINEGHL
ncbi:MAG: drug/metabolite transporter (DMT)-like permease [Urechidicola sp.]|jgi:drug/metabolite transporter (DMT)-like permease